MCDVLSCVYFNHLCLFYHNSIKCIFMNNAMALRHLVFWFLYFLIQVHGGEARRGGCPKPTLVSLRLGDANGASLKLPGIGAYLNLPSLSLSRKADGSESVPGRQIALIPGLLSIIVPSDEPTDPAVPALKLFQLPFLPPVTLNFPMLQAPCPTPPGTPLPRLPFLPRIRIQVPGMQTCSHSPVISLSTPLLPFLPSITIGVDRAYAPNDHTPGIQLPNVPFLPTIRINLPGPVISSPPLTPGFQIPTLPFMPTLRVNLPTTPKFKGIRAKGIKLPSLPGLPFIKIGPNEVVTNPLQLKIAPSLFVPTFQLNTPALPASWPSPTKLLIPPLLPFKPSKIIRWGRLPGPLPNRQGVLLPTPKFLPRIILPGQLSESPSPKIKKWPTILPLLPWLLMPLFSITLLTIPISLLIPRITFKPKVSVLKLLQKLPSILTRIPFVAPKLRHFLPILLPALLPLPRLAFKPKRFNLRLSLRLPKFRLPKITFKPKLSLKKLPLLGPPALLPLPHVSLKTKRPMLKLSIRKFPMISIQLKPILPLHVILPKLLPILPMISGLLPLWLPILLQLIIPIPQLNIRLSHPIKPKNAFHQPPFITIFNTFKTPIPVIHIPKSSISVPLWPFGQHTLKNFKPTIKIPYLVPHLAFRPLGSIILNPFNVKFLPGVSSDRPILDESLNPKNKPTQVGYSPSNGSPRSGFAKYINPLRLPFFPGSGGTSPRGIISILINPLNIESLPGAGVSPPRSILGNFVNPYKLPFQPFSGDDVPRNLFSVIINPLNIKAFAGAGKQKSPSYISSYLNPLNIVGLAGASGGKQGRVSRMWNMIQDAFLHKGLLSAISQTIGFNVSRSFRLMALMAAATGASSAFPVISTAAAPMVFRRRFQKYFMTPFTKPFSFKIMMPFLHPKIKMMG